MKKDVASLKCSSPGIINTLECSSGSLKSSWGNIAFIRSMCYLYKLTALNPSHPVCFLILRPNHSIVFKLLFNLEIIFATISSRLTRFSVLVFNCCGLRLWLKLTSRPYAAAFLKLSSSHHIIFENRLRHNLSFDYMPTLEREAQIILLPNHQSFYIILIDLISET